MSKPLLVEKIQDRELIMLAMVEEGCMARFETRNGCVLGQLLVRREGTAA